jgi:PTS system glucose-specific IIA component
MGLGSIKEEKMGFFDKFKKKSSVPEALSVSAPAGTLLAPVSGTAMDLSEVSDPVFSSGAMGKGCGVKPSGETVYAPADGTLTVIGAPNFHALALATDDGAEILIHVGVDTVEMKGDGFKVFAEKGSKVKAGTPLLSFSKQKIAAAGHDDVVIMAITNTDDMASVDFAKSGEVNAGDVVVKYAK